MELRIHPVLSALPELGKDDPLFVSLVENVRDNGVEIPLVCIEPDLIVDGRERWKAAKRLRLPEVPVVFHRRNEPASVIVSSLTRKHYSKGALAYVMFPLLPYAFEESRNRRLANLRRGAAVPESALSAPSGTFEDLAERLGVCRRLLFQAKEVRAEFDKDKSRYEFQDEGEPMTLKEYYEPRLLSYGSYGRSPEKPLGLGAIIAGIAGLRATGGKHRPDPKQLELFESAFETLRVRFSYWSKFATDEKSKCREVIRSTVAAMPQDLRDELAAAIKSFRTGTMKGAK
jgi:hypothetical protein